MQSKYEIIKFGPEDVETIRKEFNFDTEEKREAVFKVIEEWLLKQDHLVKKTFSRDYIERCIITCKGSVERAKLQIDKICTLRTLMPKYFQITNIQESELMVTLRTCDIAYLPNLTKDRYRVFMLRTKPVIDEHSVDFERLHKYLSFTAEFLKSNDYCRGFVFIADCLEVNLSEIISKINLVEFRQFLPILTEGHGCKIKGIIFLTSSKVIDGFVKIIKPFFKEKIRNRIHVATSKERLKDFLLDDVQILPKEYGGNEKPLVQLHDDLLATLSTEPIQKLLKEMNSAYTDESKRQTDKFNDQYTGMPGSFRTISLD